MLRPWTCSCGQTNAGPGPCSSCLAAAPAEVVGSPALTRAELPGGAQRSARLTTLLVVAICALLVGGVAGLGFVAAARNNRDGSTRVATPTTPTAPPAPGTTLMVAPGNTAPPTAAPLERALPDLLAFIEGARGLKFKQPVNVELLGDDAFRQRLRTMNDEDEAEGEDPDVSTDILRALGLIEGDVDLESFGQDLVEDVVLGVYDTEDDKLLVRGDKFSPLVRVTLVHELTHALQDQHFDIQRTDLADRDDDSETGLRAVVEGDAVRIEELYEATLTTAEQRAAQDEEIQLASGVAPDVPPILIQLLTFPYVVGPPFVRALVAAGGQARLDEAFRNPPTTTEQLLRPDLFLAGQGAVDVVPPGTDRNRKSIDDGMLGQLDLLLVLSTHVDPNTTQRAAAGWGGGRYVAWREGDEACVRSNVVMDTDKDRQELVDALGEFRRSRRGVTVRTGNGAFVTFTACG